jgi:hypothetical protein
MPRCLAVHIKAQISGGPYKALGRQDIGAPSRLKPINIIVMIGCGKGGELVYDFSR